MFTVNGVPVHTLLKRTSAGHAAHNTRSSRTRSRTVLSAYPPCPGFCRWLHFTLPRHKGGSLGATAFQTLPQILTSAGRNSSEMARGLDIYKWYLLCWNSICSRLHVLFIKTSCDLHILKPVSCVSCPSWSFLKKKNTATLWCGLTSTVLFVST